MVGAIVADRLNGRLQRLERTLVPGADDNEKVQYLKGLKLEELKRLRALMEDGRAYSAEELGRMLL